MRLLIRVYGMLSYTTQGIHETHCLRIVHSGPSSPLRVTRVSSTLLMLRSVPHMVMDVPPDIGPNDGSTPATVGTTTVNSDPPTTTLELVPR